MSPSIQRVYVEEAVSEHPRALAVLERFPKAEQISCGRYGEVFNRKAQNFRLQKQRPALILAEKFDRLCLPAPKGYGIGSGRNFYFSHMLNCIYDCRYCFLQGMYLSANYVLFVNYEDFFDSIERTIEEFAQEECYFFSGYDCDSLALDSVTGFVEEFVPFFFRHPRAWLEVRTKSTRIEALQALEAIPNCVVAFSFTPAEAHADLEAGVPPIERRLEAMVKLAECGWWLGLRFDPLLYGDDFEKRYKSLFETVFSRLPVESLHSVSYGPFRLPRDFYERMYRLYPDEPLLAGPLDTQGRTVSYGREREMELLEFCHQELGRYVPEEIFFPCRVPE
ncbi:MAG: DNA photolyase [Acidobacteriota bacterium]|nr:DNA photolyase [Acidobacteriota bacterium]